MSRLGGTLYLTKGASSYIAYLLIFGVLFDCADDAIRSVEDGKISILRTRIANATKDQMEMIDAYVAAKGEYKGIRIERKGANSLIRAYLKGIGLIDFSGEDAGPRFAAAKAFFCEKKVARGKRKSRRDRSRSLGKNDSQDGQSRRYCLEKDRRDLT